MRCKRCESEKQIEEFPKTYKKPGGVRTVCKDCVNLKRNKAFLLRYHNDHEFRAKQIARSKASFRNYRLKKWFGWTTEGYNRERERLGFTCPLCHKTEAESNDKLVIDHDHKTGLVRGLICRKCNLLIGYANDSVDLLAEAAAYIIEHESSNIHRDAIRAKVQQTCDTVSH